MGETDANVAKFLNRYSDGIWRVPFSKTRHVVGSNDKRRGPTRSYPLRVGDVPGAVSGTGMQLRMRQVPSLSLVR